MSFIRVNTHLSSVYYVSGPVLRMCGWGVKDMVLASISSDFTDMAMPVDLIR